MRTAKRKRGRPKGAGSQRIEYRVTDAQYSELKREARGDANGAAKRRAFPPPTENATPDAPQGYSWELGPETSE